MKNHKKLFNLIAEEFNKLDERVVSPETGEPIEFLITATNFTKDGYDLFWVHNGLEVGDRILRNLEKTIRVDNKLWFDSGFGEKGREWNLDWSLKQM